MYDTYNVLFSDACFLQNTCSLSAFQEYPIYVVDEKIQTNKPSLSSVMYLHDELFNSFLSLDYANCNIRSALSSITVGKFRVPIVSISFERIGLISSAFVNLFCRDMAKYFKENMIYGSCSFRLVLQSGSNYPHYIELDQVVDWPSLLIERKKSLWYDEETFRLLVDSVDPTSLADSIATNLTRS